MQAARIADDVNAAPRPDFVCVVGAPRSGTTSLAGFLEEHPQVCFSAVKEPHYFSRFDLDGLREAALRQAVEDQYLARYFPHREAGRLLAEGSVSYLYAPERMAPILRCWPDARFVIAVRDPLEMLPSLHRRLLLTGDETEADFARAWALMPERRNGRRIPRSCIEPRVLQYAQAGRLGAHVDAFFRAVGRERCFVVVFDDLVAAPDSVYEQLVDFLRLAPHPRSDFAPRRASRGCKVAWLQRLLKRPPVATRAVLAGEKYRRRVRPLDRPGRDPRLVRGVLAVRRALLRWNHAPPPPARLSPELRKEICDSLAGEVEHLAALLGRDLSHWLDGAPSLARPVAAPAASPPPYRPQIEGGMAVLSEAPPQEA